MTERSLKSNFLAKQECYCFVLKVFLRQLIASKHIIYLPIHMDHLDIHNPRKKLACFYQTYTYFSFPHDIPTERHTRLNPRCDTEIIIKFNI